MQTWVASRRTRIAVAVAEGESGWTRCVHSLAGTTQRRPGTPAVAAPVQALESLRRRRWQRKKCPRQGKRRRNRRRRQRQRWVPIGCMTRSSTSRLSLSTPCVRSSTVQALASLCGACVAVPERRALSTACWIAVSAIAVFRVAWVALLLAHQLQGRAMAQQLSILRRMRRRCSSARFSTLSCPSACARSLQATAARCARRCQNCAVCLRCSSSRTEWLRAVPARRRMAIIATVRRSRRAWARRRVDGWQPRAARRRRRGRARRRAATCPLAVCPQRPPHQLITETPPRRQCSRRAMERQGGRARAKGLAARCSSVPC